jgi:hypothetical protein
MTVTPSDIGSEERTRLQDLHGVCWNTEDTFDEDEPDYREIMEYHRGIVPAHWYLPFHPTLSRMRFETEMEAYEEAALDARVRVREKAILADMAKPSYEDLEERLAELESSKAWALTALAEAERVISASDHNMEVLSLVRDVIRSGEAKPTEGNIRLNARPIQVRVGDDHEGGVVPLLIKRCTDDEANVWATADGRSVYFSREWAEKSEYMKTDEYRIESDAFAKAKHLVKAVEVPLSEYDGWVTGSGDENDYARDIDELLEKRRDQLAWAGVSAEDIPAHLPAWVHCCTEDVFDFDIEDAIRCYLDDNHHEDAADWIKDWKGLDEFWSTWVDKQKNLRSQMMDNGRIIVIDRDRYEFELAAAKEYLDRAQ